MSLGGLLNSVLGFVLILLAVCLICYALSRVDIGSRY